ncbi:MAG TPA: hypothetical protein VFV07_06290 [Rhizomicrobium sp.]|nr:hypothetical protein [Rhizomicrobium sp.]
MRYFLGVIGVVAALFAVPFGLQAWRDWRVSDGPRDLAFASLKVVDAEAEMRPVLELDFTSRIDLEAYVHLHGLNIAREISQCRDARIEETSRVMEEESVHDRSGEINSTAEHYGQVILPRPKTSGPADSTSLFHYRVFLPARYEKSGRRFDLEQGGNLCLQIVALSELADPHFESNVLVIPAKTVRDAFARATGRT